MTCTAYPSVTVTIRVEFRYALSGAVPFFGFLLGVSASFRSGEWCCALVSDLRQCTEIFEIDKKLQLFDSLYIAV
jgi:hypothetical protein